MTMNMAQMSDEALTTETKEAARVERQATARLLRLLIEVERRGLQLALGYPSMFVYCTRALCLSEQAAYSRITTARAARRFPQLLHLLDEGALTLSSIGLLAPHLTDETAELLLEAARHKSTREVERLIANAHPQPDIPMQVRALPMPVAHRDDVDARSLLNSSDPADVVSPGQFAPESASVSERPLFRTPNRSVAAPIGPSRYLLKLTISEDTHDKWQRARVLMRHAVPDGDADGILNRALTLLLAQVARTKFADARRPRQANPTMPSGRRIPAAVKRAVWTRDHGHCVFAGTNGPCGETAFLEFHHVVPFAAGGATDVDNLQLRCRAHNAYEARLYFGEQAAAECL